MKLQLVNARQGALWVRRGALLFFRRPMAFAGLFMVFLLTAFVLSLLPWIGPLLMLALLPLASLGFMIASRTAIEGGLPTPRAFIVPLRGAPAERRAIIELGVVYAAATFCILWASDGVDGGALEALMDALPASRDAPGVVADKMADPRLGIGLLVRFGLAALLAVPFWHAPALVHWGGQTAAKALFFSAVACWRNRGAFMVYSLVWVALILVFGVLANLVFALLGQAPLVALVAMPASLVFSTIFYASLYATFSDCFEATLTPALSR